MIYIYTETFCWWPRLKYYVKVLLGRQNRGPKAVEDSLMRGLTHLGQEFSVNQKISEPIEVACVLSGAATLRKIIAKKRSGQVKYTIAGPVISVLPGEHNGLMASPEMDVIIVPSGWVKNLWISQNPSLAGKIQVWPAGVRDLGEHRDVAGAALVFVDHSDALETKRMSTLP